MTNLVLSERDITALNDLEQEVRLALMEQVLLVLTTNLLPAWKIKEEFWRIHSQEVIELTDLTLALSSLISAGYVVTAASQSNFGKKINQVLGCEYTLSKLGIEYLESLCEGYTRTREDFCDNELST